jgi:uncharacterized protein (DUF1501 family)
MSCAEHLTLSRRRLLAGGGASLALWSMSPRLALAGARDPRLLCVVLRGGLDGLSMVAPVGDPEYSRLRGPITVPASGEGAGLPLDGFFVLNPNMPVLHGLYKRGEALIVHAVATPYRGRSHFDGQDILESGLSGKTRFDDGWLNRALAVLPSRGKAAPAKGLSIGAAVPLVMRGSAPVLAWTMRANNQSVRDSTIARLQDLYAETDPALAKAFAEGLDVERIATTAVAGKSAARDGPVTQAGHHKYPVFIEAAEAATRFLTLAGGPRIGALAFNGWDTHANSGAVKGVLAKQMAGLDQAIESLVSGLGPAWKDTVIVIVTEFGRTARINGTAGTDHGTATVALLVGGAVKGGRILADWPGLAQSKLYEGRDLAPTSDLRGIIKGVLRDHLGLPDGPLGTSVFPDSRIAATVSGLVA